jgi:hypothetical protein
LSHAAAQAANDRFDHDLVPGVYRPPIAHAFDSHEEGQLRPVFRFREDHDRADLRDRFRENCRREHGGFPRPVREVALVQRDVLDADNPLVRFELDDAVHEQKRIAMRKNALDGRVVERERDVHRVYSREV